MRFHWGVGIVVFLALFLMAAAAFIIFAFNQDVSLVHEDYYERGADYDNQMEIDERSAKYEDLINTIIDEENLVIGFKEMPPARIDSGLVRLYRPSDIDLDIEIDINESELSWKINAKELFAGRYTLELTWFMEGLQHEIRKPVILK